MWEVGELGACESVTSREPEHSTIQILLRKYDEQSCDASELEEYLHMPCDEHATGHIFRGRLEVVIGNALQVRNLHGNNLETTRSGCWSKFRFTFL